MDETKIKGVARPGTLILSITGLLAALTAWLWPIGAGGRMPVGGDVTSFSIGLMAVFAEALRARRLPIWNDLWGFGFPGLAESQMGVYYPPHLLLYGLMPLEAAYTASLFSHTLWGGLGAFWAARKFGISAPGSALAGFSWASCGFFVIHLPHHWAYTTGSWMPWAWGLAWSLSRGVGTRRHACALAAVLTLQVLPGHFQLAFCTQVGIALMALSALAEPGLRRAGGVRGVFVLAIVTLTVIPLAAMQLWPTFRLARLAASQRDYEYLSGFASTPLHLVSYVAPELFHRSPLWRPLAWDPFRTSPEEHLAYIGLVPLFLAIAVLLREWRRDPATRVLGALTLSTLVLSLGPYVPGFRLLIMLPGFSYFRAPARWGLATELALCLLAGRGYDAIRSWPRPGRAIVRFAVVTSLGPCLAIAMVELAMASTVKSGWPALSRVFTMAARRIPGPEPQDFEAWMDLAHRPQRDIRVESALARQGFGPIPPPGLRFDRERWSIYPHELGRTAVFLGLITIVAPWANRRRFLGAALLALTVADLWTLMRRRPIDLAPIRPLIEQSEVLARLSHEPRGTRTADPARNLPMVAGAAPILSYRTLDLPAMVTLRQLAASPPGGRDTDTLIVVALRATGTSLRLLEPFETIEVTRRVADPESLPGWSARETIRDRALAGWLFGADWVALQGTRAETFTLWRPGPDASKAWLVPLTSRRSPSILETSTGEPAEVLRVLESSTPVAIRSSRPERLELTVDVEGPSALVLTQLADPQWCGSWVGPGGEQAATIVPAFVRPGEHGWQAISVPGPGHWTLHMEYDARDVRAGQVVSGLSIMVGLGVTFWPGRKRPNQPSGSGRK